MSLNEAGGGYLGSTSHPLRYHPPRLPLAPSTYRAGYGSTLGLSGRLASGLAGMKIAILARAYGQSAVHQIAKVTTGPGGHWSYRARPSIQTTYIARIGSTTTPRVTIGVAPAIAVGELSNGPWGALTWSHAAAAASYSWISPPSRSRRRIAIAPEAGSVRIEVTAGGSGACRPSARCGLCSL